MKRSLPWRTIAPSRETGRFTPEQLDAAVLAVMEHNRTRRTAGGAMIARERGPEFGASPRPEPTAPEAAPGAEAAPQQHGCTPRTGRSADER